VNFAMLVIRAPARRVRRDAGARGAFPADHDVQRLEGARQGVGVYGAIARRGQRGRAAARRRADEYLSWRWCLYINLVFAGAAVVGGLLLLKPQARVTGGRLDVPGVVMVSSGVFCLVYGFSNAAQHSWSASFELGLPHRGRRAAHRVRRLAGRTGHPLLPPRVVLDRNRGGAYLRS